MSENNLDQNQGPVLGIALDGVGLGDDNTLWGGEFLLCEYSHSRRVGTFKPIALPGGAKAMREPWRNTFAHILGGMGWSTFTARFHGLKLHEFLASKPIDMVTTMLHEGLNSPLASSCGRLFDAVASAMGICGDESLYEGEAAMRLESLVNPEALAAVEDHQAYPFEVVTPDGGVPFIEPLKMWYALFGDLYENVPSPIIAARFHKGLAKTISNMACRIVLDDDRRLTHRIVLSGGVMQNRWLVEELVPRLEAESFEVLLQSKFPSNDGGLSLGQAAVACATLRQGN